MSTKASRAENTRRAIAVMTAYYSEEKGTALASQVATDYANEPDGQAKLIDGFVHLSARLILTVAAEFEMDRTDVLRELAKDVNASDE